MLKSCDQLNVFTKDGIYKNYTFKCEKFIAETTVKRKF